MSKYCLISRDEHGKEQVIAYDVGSAGFERLLCAQQILNLRVTWADAELNNSVRFCVHRAQSREKFRCIFKSL